MDTPENDQLQVYLNKLTTLRDGRKDAPLSPAERKEMALSLGFSESDFQLAESSFQNHLVRAQTLMRFNNYDEAIKELNVAYTFNAQAPDVLIALANAHKSRYLDLSKSIDKDRSLRFANECLQVDPANYLAAKLISDFKQTTAIEKRSNSMPSYGIFVILLILIGVGFGFYITANNSGRALEKIAHTEVAEIAEQAEVSTTDITADRTYSTEVGIPPPDSKETKLELGALEVTVFTWGHNTDGWYYPCVSKGNSTYEFVDKTTKQYRSSEIFSRNLQVGETVSAKIDNEYEECTIKKKRGDRYMVETSKGIEKFVPVHFMRIKR